MIQHGLNGLSGSNGFLSRARCSSLGAALDIEMGFRPERYIEN